MTPAAVSPRAGVALARRMMRQALTLWQFRRFAMDDPRYLIGAFRYGEVCYRALVHRGAEWQWRVSSRPRVWPRKPAGGSKQLGLGL